MKKIRTVAEETIDCKEEIVGMMEMFNISIKGVDYSRYAFIKTY